MADTTGTLRAQMSNAADLLRRADYTLPDGERVIRVAVETDLNTGEPVIMLVIVGNATALARELGTVAHVEKSSVEGSGTVYAVTPGYSGVPFRVFGRLS